MDDVSTPVGPRFDLLGPSRQAILTQRFVGSITSMATQAEFRLDAVSQVVTGLNASVRSGRYDASLSDVRQARRLTSGLLRQLADIERAVACRAAASTHRPHRRH